MGMSKEEFRRRILERQKLRRIREARAAEREAIAYRRDLDTRIKNYKYRRNNGKWPRLG